MVARAQLFTVPCWCSRHPMMSGAVAASQVHQDSSRHQNASDSDILIISRPLKKTGITTMYSVPWLCYRLETGNPKERRRRKECRLFVRCEVMMLFGSKVTVTSTVCTVRLNARLSEVTVTWYLRTQIQESQLHKKCSVSLFNQSTHTHSLSLSVCQGENIGLYY